MTDWLLESTSLQARLEDYMVKLERAERELAKSRTLKTYTSVDFKGVWPIPTAAVVVAETTEEAAMFLDAELKSRGLPGFDGNLTPLPETKGCTILNDGEY